MHEAEYYEEGSAHRNHVKVERLPLPVVRLLNYAGYNVNWEEPEATSTQSLKIVVVRSVTSCSNIIAAPMGD